MICPIICGIFQHMMRFIIVIFFGVALSSDLLATIYEGETCTGSSIDLYDSVLYVNIPFTANSARVVSEGCLYLFNWYDMFGNFLVVNSTGCIKYRGGGAKSASVSTCSLGMLTVSGIDPSKEPELLPAHGFYALVKKFLNIPQRLQFP